MTGALVLNGTFEPICVVSGRRAICLVLAGKADLIESDGGEVRSERLTMARPSIIRLRYVVKVPYVRRTALSRRAVFARDDHRCQYCGATADSIDHVVPRSRGGEHAWDNVVAACRPCNIRKRDRPLEESGMRLARRPVAPRDISWVTVAVGRVPEAWRPYLDVRAAGLTA
jgi:5-methylcytosine-specific restriction endonuclease McrA